MAFSVIAHGLRSPTAVVSGYARMLREGRLTGDASDRALAGMAAAADDIGALASQVADLADWSGPTGREAPPSEAIPPLVTRAVTLSSDPSRVKCDLSAAPAPQPSSGLASLLTALVTLIDVVLGQLTPEESLTLLLRQDDDRTEWRIDLRPSGQAEESDGDADGNTGGVWRAAGLPLFVAVATLEAHGGALLSVTHGGRRMMLRVAVH